MQLSVVHGGPSARFSQVFRWLQPLTDDHFRDDKKGGLFSWKGPYLPGGSPILSQRWGQGGKRRELQNFTTPGQGC